MDGSRVPVRLVCFTSPSGVSCCSAPSRPTLNWGRLQVQSGSTLQMETPRLRGRDGVSMPVNQSGRSRTLTRFPGSSCCQPAALLSSQRKGWLLTEDEAPFLAYLRAEMCVS